MSTCRFPLCHRNPQSNGYCIGHKIYATSPALNIKVPEIKKRGSKLSEEFKEYKKVVTAYLLKNRVCVIKSPDCTKVATCVHHKKRRGVNLLEVKYFAASCGPCNSYVERFPKFAYAGGHSIKVHSKEQL